MDGLAQNAGGATRPILLIVHVALQLNMKLLVEPRHERDNNGKN